MSEGRVRQRLKKMENAKAMRIGLIADIATAGYPCSAILHNDGYRVLELLQEFNRYACRWQATTRPLP